MGKVKLKGLTEKAKAVIDVSDDVDGYGTLQYCIIDDEICQNASKQEIIRRYYNALDKLADDIPAENEVQITSENYDDYLTNSYLDTTLSQKEEFSLPLTITYILLIIIVILLIITVFDKGKIIEQVEHKSKKIFFNLKNKIAKRK